MKWILLIVLFCFSATLRLQAQATADTTVKTTDSVKIQARFPGGQEGWIRYLQHNLRAEVGAENLQVKKHHTVRQTVIVSFLVDKQGKISEVTVANPTEVHPKLGEEAVRVIRTGPDWIPATINGEPVIYRQRQAITFEVSSM